MYFVKFIDRYNNLYIVNKKFYIVINIKLNKVKTIIMSAPILDTHSIAVVAPLFNEEGTVSELVRRIREACNGFNYIFIAVDDGSTDATLDILKSLAKDDPRLKVISLSRNFGHQAAMNAGLDHATGVDAVILMDGDLQDPPELIPKLIEEWQRGYDVVYAVRKNRKEGPLLRLAYKLFYRLLARVATVPIPLDSGDFCLMSRRAADAVRALPERNRFLRGLRSWVGFKQTGIPYERPARFAGRPKYNFTRLINLAFDGIFSLSGNLLRYVMFLGLIIFAMSVCYTVYVILDKFLNPDASIKGWYSTVVLISSLSGLQLFFIGLLGEYVNRVFQEVKARPVYIVKEYINMNE